MNVNLECLPYNQLKELVEKEWESIAGSHPWFSSPEGWLDQERTIKSPALKANDMGLWLFNQPKDPIMITREKLLELHQTCIQANAWIQEKF